MISHYRTQGFIFKKIDFGEVDRFYLVFTKDFGKLNLLAKGVRKIKAKLKSSLELFNFSEIEFVQGKNYKTLTDALIIESFPDLKRDLIKLKIAFRISELFDKLLKGEERDEAIWQLSQETFRELDKWKLKAPNSLESENFKLKIIYYYFLWNFLSLLGYRPQIQKCVNCQRRIDLFKKIYFSSSEGGVLCSLCAKRIKEQEDLSLNTLKLLKVILGGELSFLKRLKLKRKELEKLSKLSQNYLSFIEKTYEI